ncbi:TIGR01548 family HAD-type hydrolase [Prochlorococcus marinus]|uniref:TIGR01548 family HAD-type hydrolase n=1 Tax=Prochlorococcus marinus TaxID=1219 RepID=UPI0022B53E75|nr:TIGR01548 family HAD-type hydrolase [Prochlorococcus marinus]
MNLNLKGLVLFDIDGVIRDVAKSYRLSVQKTVKKFCGWEPTNKTIDELKSEGFWNNDWDASLELIKRHINSHNLDIKLPKKTNLIKEFSTFYFGENFSLSPNEWNGFIKNEKLLVEKEFFQKLTEMGFNWGFVSGAEPPSAKFVLENRLGLTKPPLIAMGEAPEKPDPSGFIKLASNLLPMPLGKNNVPIAYLGDTVADVMTVENAREILPTQKFISIAVAPPHLHSVNNSSNRNAYEKKLIAAGANKILKSTNDIFEYLATW